jgi:threonine dehydrogenase-like Zn-dependent dehydrogenase
VTVLGSRCGPFPEAINALARKAVDVRFMISRTYPLREAATAFEASHAPHTVKILLRP